MKRERSVSDSGRKRRKGDYLEENGITVDGGEIRPATAFDALDVPDGLKTALGEFDEPTPIQACTWPPALDGRDVVGIAETGRSVRSLSLSVLLALTAGGSGKTLAFGIPALARLLASKKKKSVNVLVVAPTRELAIQTHDTLSALGAPFGITSVAVFGGVPKDGQVKSLGKSPRIVVGTPGRILDLVNDGVCHLKQLRVLFRSVEIVLMHPRAQCQLSCPG